ncbi:PE domain-containing protein [Amycolatopsis rhabdoformis]|uniref:PE domain-containing protein n=1 Tax=Amycolatopsis rhabdoformis TaxID=1448059 RepID=A0ABZ1I212_9PSEU|nr:PE domain-containing protein [Amycolatopsis rhabdoformis]WSE28235.1 PE domain-containing protein [Amycolatopsis rhabdoformis]
MPDGNQGGLQGVQNETLAPGHPAPANSGLLPGSNGATPPPGPPIDYKTLGAGQAKADFAAASSGNSWEFDPEAIGKVITELEDSLDHEYFSAQDHAGWLTQIIAPGSDLASEQYTTSAVVSGGSYQSFLQGAVDYTQAYVETLKSIRTAYQNQDHAALDALRNIGKAQ